MTSLNATDLNLQHLPTIVERGAELRLPVGEALPFPQLSDADKLDALLEWGCQSNAYFHLQDGISHFGIKGLGFISFYRHEDLMGPVHVTFSRPVCAPENVASLLDAYHDLVKVPTIFAGLDEQSAEDLCHRGYRINDIGSEYTLPAMSYEVAGKDKKWLRRVANMGKKGVVVKELQWADVDGDQVRDISNSWRSTKQIKNRELRLMTRPPVFGDEWGVRKFYAMRGDEVLGYLFCDPYFQDGKVIGYTTNITRSKPGVKPAGVQDYLVLEVMKVLRAEGIPYLALGLSPLHAMEETRGESRLLRWVLNGFYHYGSKFYSFKSLGFHKQRFKVAGAKSYAAIRDVGPLRAAWVTLKATNAI